MSVEKKLPSHIAIIPDGNRRWAKAHSLNPWQGHKEGVKKFVKITNEIFRLGIPYFTFWAASEDNLRKRSLVEVNFLVDLVKSQLRQGLKPFEEKDVRLRVLGQGREIIQNDSLSKAIDKYEEDSRKNKKFNLTICFGYDGVEEMLSAVRSIAFTRNFPITRETVKNALWSKELPPIDLVIRTGETDTNWAHLSAGFMMWLTANSEFYFPKLFWPDFSVDELHQALEGYSHRQRRLGA